MSQASSRCSAEVLSGRLDFLDASEKIATRSTVYVVLRCPALPSARAFRGFRAFKSSVGAIEHTDAVCHGFPTEGEARIYCAGAGVPFPAFQ